MNIPHTPSNCYGPERQRPQTESGRVAQDHNRKHNVPQYSNVAGEKERKS